MTHAFPPDGIAGVERIAQELARDLRQLGDDVTVVTRRHRKLRLRAERNDLVDGTHVVTIDGRAWDPVLPSTHERTLARLDTEAIRSSRADVVHILHLMHHSHAVIDAAHATGTPVVVSLLDHWFACPLMHLVKTTGEPCTGPDGGRECANTCFAGDGDPNRWGRRTERSLAVLRRADRIICTNEKMAAFFTAFGAPVDRIRIIRHAASADRQRLVATPAGGPQLRLAVLGAVTPSKGLHIVLDALEFVGDAPPIAIVAFGFIGDVEYARRLRARAEHLEGVDLRLYGAYETDELPWLLGSFDAAVVPTTLPESFGRTAYEALSLGLPVLAAARGGLCDAVDHGTNGFLFDPTRPAELADLIRRLRADPQLLDRLRHGARTTVLRTTQQFAADVRQTYDELVTVQQRARSSAIGYQGSLPASDPDRRVPS